MKSQRSSAVWKHRWLACVLLALQVVRISSLGLQTPSFLPHHPSNWSLNPLEETLRQPVRINFVKIWDMTLLAVIRGLCKFVQRIPPDKEYPSSLIDVSLLFSFLLDDVLIIWGEVTDWLNVNTSKIKNKTFSFLFRWPPLFQHCGLWIKRLSRGDNGTWKSWEVDLLVQRDFTFHCNQGLARRTRVVRLQSFEKLRHMRHGRWAFHT